MPIVISKRGYIKNTFYNLQERNLKQKLIIFEPFLKPKFLENETLSN